MAHAHVADRVHLRLVKGSHIVVPKLFEHDHAYIFQNADGRIIFAIPYEGEFTLIGTTDVEHHGAIGEARADADEIAYLCAQASRYFATPVTPAQVVWTYSGVRPLLDDESGNPAAVTRDYRLELDARRRRSRCSRSGAARSRPFASSPKRRPTAARAGRSRDVALAAPGPQRRRCPAATCAPCSAPARRRPATSSRPSSASSPRSRARHPSLPAALVRRLARAYGTRAERPARRTASAPRSRPGLRGRARLPAHATNGRAAATTCSGAAPSSACISTPAGRDAVTAWMAARAGPSAERSQRARTPRRPTPTRAATRRGASAERRRLSARSGASGSSLTSTLARPRAAKWRTSSASTASIARSRPASKSPPWNALCIDAAIAAHSAVGDAGSGRGRRRSRSRARRAGGRSGRRCCARCPRRRACRTSRRRARAASRARRR